MRLLKFNVIGQELVKDPECDFENIVAGSRNYLKVHFNLPEEWRNCNVAASFWRGSKEYAVMLKDGMCDVHEDVLDFPTFRVSLTCLRGTQLIPTNKILIRQEVRR